MVISSLILIGYHFCYAYSESFFPDPDVWIWICSVPRCRTFWFTDVIIDQFTMKNSSWNNFGFPLSWIRIRICGPITLAGQIRIRDILVRIRILGSVPLTNGSGCGSVPKSSVTFRMQKNLCFSYFFLFKLMKLNFKSFKIVKICLMIKIKFLQENFCIKILFCNDYFSPLNTFMRKRKDPFCTCDGSGCGSGRPRNLGTYPDLEHWG